MEKGEKSHLFWDDKVTSLPINIKIDDDPITSRSHTHPSHSQTSHLLSSTVSISFELTIIGQLHPESGKNQNPLYQYLRFEKLNYCDVSQDLCVVRDLGVEMKVVCVCLVNCS